MRYFAITMTALFATALFTGSALAAGMGGESKSMDQKQGSSYGMEQQDQMSGQAGTEQMGQEQQQTAGTQLEQEKVRQIQQTLQDRGIDAGPVDGIMGPETREGIRVFQQEQGLTATGEPTEETLEYMGISPAFGEGTQQQEMQQDQMSGQAATEQMGQQQTAGTQLDQEQISEIQQTLNDRGFDAGPVDGIMGPKTRRGIQNFQEEQGLTASGEPTQETLEYMGISPAFGEQQDQMQQQPMQQDQMQEQESDLMQEEESFQEQQQEDIER